MSRLNPGISAAGAAAGRSAQNPSVGPAAIGGMLSSSPEEPIGFDAPEPAVIEERLTLVVSAITRLADAMEALVVRMPAGASTSDAAESPTAHAVIGRHGRRAEDAWGGGAVRTRRTPERVTADAGHAERASTVQTMDPDRVHWRPLRVDSA
jgi:hypothetical protein